MVDRKIGKKRGSPKSPRLPPKSFTAATNAYSAENLSLFVNLNQQKEILTSNV